MPTNTFFNLPEEKKNKILKSANKKCLVFDIYHFNWLLSNDDILPCSQTSFYK